MKQLVQSLLGTLGYRLTRVQNLPVHSPNPPPLTPLERFFLALQTLNFQPTHILDVGANHGSWTRQALRFFPNCAYTLVEPQAQLKAHVTDLLEAYPAIQWVTAGASDRHTTLKFTIFDRDDSSNFRFSSEAAAAQGFQQIEVEVFTLNEIVSNHSAAIPEIVKIDTEGFDLKVMAGASELIGKTEIFLLESAICAKGIENTLNRNIAVMERLGYIPFDITDLNRSPTHGVLWLCEMAFIKRNSLLLEPLINY